MPPRIDKSPMAPKGAGLDEALEKVVTAPEEEEPSKKRKKDITERRPTRESPRGTVGSLLAERAQKVSDDQRKSEAKKRRSRKSRDRGSDKRKKRSRGVDDSDTDMESSGASSGSSSEVFRSPSTRGEGDLFRLAKKHPGKLLKSGLKEMGHYLAERVGGDPEAGWQDRKVMAYINQVLLVQHPPQQLGLRNLREAQTLGMALDLARAGDLLMQRLKALETAVSDQSWHQAKHQELIPPQAASLSKVTEKEQAAKLEIRAAKLRSVMTKKSPK